MNSTEGKIFMTKSAITKLAVLVCALVPAVGQQHNGSAPAKAGSQQEISCPVPEVKTEITTNLPKPWWNTPQIGKLQSVGIQVIAGEKTLVCHYSAYGTQVSVMRKFPEGARDCKTVGNRFECH
jgi:hypothetical protein